ncbi:PucR family transcriptional regulator [Alkalihalobacillus sp. TS-13]|uniref:PucR family transcriptional regulator n=1 Tax=Alkalihalobacillus sp. TS-13 TaxID=2842455 RepID=UPI001C88940C|nr:PucR family transcriptional regulator [Alkalihalobacillus sp. TS-13]
MSLTVKDFIELDIMESARVRTGQGILSERYVQWISAIEMPVENFVRKNEVVLSTAIGCGQDLDSLKQFVQDIIDSKASTLVIALGRHIFDIPQEVIELAKKKDFIIIEIPWEVRFANIVEEVMAILNGVNREERQKSEKVQQELLNLILQEKELPFILSSIQKHTGYPILLTDEAGAIQGKSGNFIELRERRGRSYFFPDEMSGNPEEPLVTHDPMFQKFQEFEIAGQSVLRLPILKVSGNPQGYLFVLIPPDASIESLLTEFRVNVLDHAATTIALWLARKNAVEDTKMRLRSDFVQELAKGEFHSLDQANSRAQLLGYNLKVPYICIVGLPENLKTLFEKWKKEYHSYEHWFKSMIRYIEEEIIYAGQSLAREVMMTYQGEHLIIYLESTGDEVSENPADFLDLVDRRLRNLLPGVVISWGSGDYQHDLNGFKESYHHAQTALKIGRSKKGIGQRMMYEDTRVDRVLLSLSQNSEMKQIIMSTIDPLVQYDEKRNMDLIGTFSTYNQYQGNVSKTSRALNLHRQSLLYRLRKIETLTGLSLIDPDNLFLLDLSIKTWKIGLSKDL